MINHFEHFFIKYKIIFDKWSYNQHGLGRLINAITKLPKINVILK